MVSDHKVKKKMAKLKEMSVFFRNFEAFTKFIEQ